LRKEILGFFGIAGLLCAGLPTHADTPAAMSYAGPCDASAAVAIDASQFVVANDESNVLMTYRFGEPKSLRSLDVSRFLDIGKKQEADIEGAATIGARTYWITSHSRNSKDQVQSSRYHLFATELRDDAKHPLVTVGKPYKRLLRDLTNAPPLARFGLAAAARLAAEQTGGLNIEGLAATPEGHLLIGLRSPLPDDHALVIPLQNPAEVVDGINAKLGEPFELDLGRRGVRSIEFVGGSYLIVAGPIADEGTFALYRWSGKRGDAAVLDPVDLGSLRPEALFAIPQTTQVQLLSDDGGVITARVACKARALRLQTFRSLVVQP
jgi:hypothetical protein